MPTLPAAISRRAMTVGLSRSASSSGCDPALICRARLVAARVSSKRFGIRESASSMVMRAMILPSGKLREQPFVAYALGGAAQPGRAHDRAQIVHGGSKVLINNNIIELPAVAHLLARGVQPARDRGFVVLPAPAQPLLEGSERRRQDEDVHRIGDQLAYLGGALPIDLEQHVLAALDLHLEPRGAGGVPVPVHVRVL